MNLQIEDKGSYKLVFIQNERLDTLLAPELKGELFSLIQTQGNNNIVLDISNCSFCDSSGLSAILVGNRLCENSSGIFIVTGIQAYVEKLIKISLLDSVLTIAKDMDEVESLLKKKAELD